eukprot:5235097-Amphidinium_carterae.1
MCLLRLAHIDPAIEDAMRLRTSIRRILQQTHEARRLITGKTVQHWAQCAGQSVQTLIETTDARPLRLGSSLWTL